MSDSLISDVSRTVDDKEYCRVPVRCQTADIPQFIDESYVLTPAFLEYLHDTDVVHNNLTVAVVVVHSSRPYADTRITYIVCRSDCSSGWRRRLQSFKCGAYKYCRLLKSVSLMWMMTLWRRDAMSPAVTVHRSSAVYGCSPCRRSSCCSSVARRNKLRSHLNLKVSLKFLVVLYLQCHDVLTGATFILHSQQDTSVRLGDLWSHQVQNLLLMVVSTLLRSVKRLSWEPMQRQHKRDFLKIWFDFRI